MYLIVARTFGKVKQTALICIRNIISKLVMIGCSQNYICYEEGSFLNNSHTIESRWEAIRLRTKDDNLFFVQFRLFHWSNVHHIRTRDRNSVVFFTLCCAVRGRPYAALYGTRSFVKFFTLRCTARRDSYAALCGA